MPKIKEVYEYNNGSWANGTPIGADASNVDVALSDSTSTKDLQSVLGNVSVSDPSMKTQLTGKVNASGGDIKDTVVSVLDPASETDTSEDIDGTDVVVAVGESQTTMWSKFNMFRKRVSNKFSNFLISSVEDVLEPSDTKTYSQAALNSYFADVIGYKTDADVATIGSVADQLSTLNNNVTSLNNKTTNATTIKAGLMSASDKTILDGLNTRSHTSITYAFGTIYLEKYGHSCMCGHWPTSISAIKTAYTYTGIIPEIYRPMSDVRFVAWDANNWDVQHFIQITTNGNVIVTCNVAGNIVLHYYASWVVSNI